MICRCAAAHYKKIGDLHYCNQLPTCMCTCGHCVALQVLQVTNQVKVLEKQTQTTKGR